MNYKEILSHIEDNFTERQVEKLMSELEDVLENKQNQEIDTDDFDYSDEQREYNDGI